MPLSAKRNAIAEAWFAKHAPQDAPLAHAILTAGELSTGDPKAESGKHARGLMQLTRSALEDLHQRRPELGIDPATFDYDSPTASFRAGTAYIQLLRTDYGFSNPLHIAAAYNAGPGRVREAVKAGTFTTLPEETQAYVRRIRGALPARGATEAPAPTDMSARPLRHLGPETAAADEAPGAAPPPAEPETWADVGRSALGTADRYLGQAAQGALDVGAGLADVSRFLPGASRMAAAHPIAGEPADTGERYARKGGEGAIFGPGGIAGGLIGAGGGDVTEAAGLGRTVGEIGAPLLTAGIGGIRAVARNTRAIQAEAKAAEEAAKLAVREARENTQHAVNTMKAAGAEQVAAAERVGQRAVEQAKTAEVVAGHGAQAAEAQAQQDVKAMISTATPEKRASLLETALHGGQHDFEKLRRNAWEPWMAAHGARPVDLSRVGLTAEDMIDHMVRSGVPLDAATYRAKAVLRLMRPAEEIAPELTPATTLAGGAKPPPQMTEAVTSIPFENAKELRSQLGEIFGKATGSSESRAGRLYGELTKAMEQALPNRQAVLQWRRLNAITKREVRLYRNGIVKQIFDESPQAAATADRYVVRLLTGAWTPAKAIELRTLRQALGTNTVGHEVLKDAVLRQAYTQFTNDAGLTNWGRMARALRNPDGLAPMFTGAIRDPRERQLILGLADDAANARTAATTASERAAMTETQAGKVVTDVTRRGREWTQAARAAGNQETRDAIVAARAAGARVRQVVPPRASEPTAWDRLARNLFRLTGLTTGGPVGAATVEFAIRGTRGLRWLRQPANRAAVREAMRTTADSAAGRRLIARLAPNLETNAPQLTPLLGGPATMAADQEAEPAAATR